jgi:O-succinylbenzoic acid--CoA ligase
VNDLVALALPGGPRFIDELRRAWDDGDAVLPLDPRLPAPALDAVIAALRPARVVTEHHQRSLAGLPVNEGDALVVATSGTTGVPKGVVLTHDAVLASAQATTARLGVDPAVDSWLACLPLAHIGGLSVVTHALASKTEVTVLPGFDAAAVDASEATLVSLVPTALARIDPDRWRVIVLGGSTPPEGRPANCVTTYGLTETGSGVVYNGVPLDGVEVRVDDQDQIWLRAPMLLRAYRDGTDPKDRHGWFPTGDLGRWHDGVLTVLGRADELIKTGGEKVWPADVEAVLSRLGSVGQVAIVGLDDPEWGQRVVAVVVPDGPTPPSLEELRAAVKAELPPWCAPKELVLVDRLPRTALGKLQRRALSGLLAGPPGQSASEEAQG